MKHKYDKISTTFAIKFIVKTGFNPLTGKRLRKGWTEIAKYFKITPYYAKKWGT
jgi:hypothetical protein